MKTPSPKTTVAVVGLGYVGLPLALAFGRTNIKTIGFDVKQQRIDELKKGIDSTDELTRKEVKNSKLVYSSDNNTLKEANFFIVAVPTPVDDKNNPDMSLVIKASETVAKNLKKGDIVVYESTVYPGATEEDCVPVLERISGLKWKKDFNVGYSPERINPGDKEHTLEKVVKIVSGDTPESTKIIATTYKKVCKAGVHIAPNIKTAEAAKVIENTQRDINIALMNELSLIFHKMDINTSDVLEAAGTKWNFLKFTPGLVGGHCISIDPYYLVFKAKQLGHQPQIITAGRKINDYMPEYVAQLTVDGLKKAGKEIKGAKILVMGLTFKENVKDYRNSKIGVTIKVLKKLGAEVIGFEPLLDSETIKRNFEIPSIDKLSNHFDAIIVATPHKKFSEMEKQIKNCSGKQGVIIDIKSLYPKLLSNKQLIYKNL
ncbi:MAG: nucleotide sugar dehydrogenase [bacterium]|nr:nucleotide sugar dehydrogenase [bacterium]